MGRCQAARAFPSRVDRGPHAGALRSAYIDLRMIAGENGLAWLDRETSQREIENAAVRFAHAFRFRNHDRVEQVLDSQRLNGRALERHRRIRHDSEFYASIPQQAESLPHVSKADAES
jgi:hypothetical protein